MHARLLCCAAALSMSVALGGNAGAQTSGAVSEVTFDSYSPLTVNAELARRTLTPLLRAEIPRRTLGKQPINLADEHFVTYVPPAMPARGYGLIVFIPPWDSAHLPADWAASLDARGVIFVSAARSGDDQSVLGRRAPLALLAEQNLVRRYQIDPDRVFVAGFSGGSRVALRLALAYPDIFRGAILNAGGDLVGTAATPLPPKELFDRFTGESMLVFVTGDEDRLDLATVTASEASVRASCAVNTQNQVARHADHEVMGAPELLRALDALLAPSAPDLDNLKACRAGIDAAVEAKLQAVETQIAQGDRAGAAAALKEIDERFGGLAAPKSVALMNRLTGVND